LVHAGDPDVHGDEPHSQFMLDRGAEENAVDLYRV
jgi:hypothetical protein